MRKHGNGRKKFDAGEAKAKADIVKIEQYYEEWEKKALSNIDSWIDYCIENSENPEKQRQVLDELNELVMKKKILAETIRFQLEGYLKALKAQFSDTTYVERPVESLMITEEKPPSLKEYEALLNVYNRFCEENKDNILKKWSKN